MSILKISSRAIASVSDPLSDVCRRERRMLLLISMLAILIAETGAVPTEISALGIKFSSPDRLFFLNALTLVVFYFSCAFIIYGFADYAKWKLSTTQDVMKEVKELVGGLPRDPNELVEDPAFKIQGIERNRVHFLLSNALRFSHLRILFEFILPIAVGITAIAWIQVAKIEFENKTESDTPVGIQKKNGTLNNAEPNNAPQATPKNGAPEPTGQ